MPKKTKATRAKAPGKKPATKTTKKAAIAIAKPKAVKKVAKRKAAAAKPAKTSAKKKLVTAIAPSEPSRRLRRAIFIDVENTSSESELEAVLAHLEIDRLKHRVELSAVGNWKALGTRYARMLGRVGAHLLHTAPPAGVRDWSDLWIAVSIGRWIGQADPGDLLDVVSDDRAFDAVADAAGAAGVVFRRLSYRSLTGKTREKEGHAEATEDEAPRRPRRGRRRRRPATSTASPAATAVVEPASAEPTAPETHAELSDAAAHQASEDHIREILARLSKETGAVSLDSLANTLRSEGHVRPPGSPRLLTRLRRMADVELLPNGLVRLGGSSAS